jgi:hypothetical protein
MANEFKIYNPLVVGSLASDPGTGYNGEIYYNTTSNVLRQYINGAWVNVGSGTGTGSVTSVSVVSANGFAGSVANPSSTPAITLTTTITGVLQGNGTAISAYSPGNLTDAGTDGIVITGGTGAVFGSGTSIAQHVADATHNGYLSSADWSTFNSKQSALTFSDSLVNNSGTVTLVNDSASPTASQYYGTNASSVLGYYNLPATGANTTLSNLTSPTSINQNLLPSTDNNFTLGSGFPAGLTNNPGVAWEQLFSYQVYAFTVKSPATNGALGSPASQDINMGSGQATGNSGNASLTTGISSAQSGGLFLQSGGAQSGSGAITITSGASNTGNTGAVLISSGIASSGNSGSVTIRTQTASGTRGKIFLGPSASVNLATQFSTDPVSGAVSGDFYYNTTDNSIHYYNGTSWMALATGGSAANTALSNLVTTSINQDLLPQSDQSNNLGSDSLRWNDLFVSLISGGSSLLTVKTDDPASGSSPSAGITINSGAPAGSATGASGAVQFKSGAIGNSGSSANTGNVIIGSGDNSVGSGNSGNLQLSTGAAGSGNSGDIQLTTGASSSGLQGRVLLSSRSLGLPKQSSDPGSATSGDLYYNTGGNVIKYYNGTVWTQLATGGTAANTTLSNLTSPTAVNQDLLPDGDSTRNLGQSGFQWDVISGSSLVNWTGQLVLSGAGGISANSNVISNVSNPIASTDAANKFYVDNAIAGLQWKAPVEAASIGSNINLAAPGSTLDGYSFSSGDRFLAKDQSTTSQNGIYIWNGAATPATRSSDMSTWAEVAGAVMLVFNGTVNMGSKWVNTNVPGGTLGTTSITFVAFSVAGTVNGTGTSGQIAYWTGTSTIAGENQVTAAQGGTGVDSSASTGVAHVTTGSWTFSSVVASDLGTITDGITLDQAGAGSTLEVKAGGIGATQLANNGVTNAKLAQMPADTLKGNNTGSTANAADLTVSQVTAMIGVTTATASSLVERDSSGNIYANQSNDQAASGPQRRMSTNGSSWLEEQYVDSITLTNNTSNSDVDASTTFAFATYAGYQAEYYITDGSSPTLVAIGKLTVVANSDGSASSITDTRGDTSDIGVSFTVIFSGSNAVLQYTTTNTSDRTMRIKITRFRR